jgi:hypothetical protein
MGFITKLGFVVLIIAIIYSIIVSGFSIPPLNNLSFSFSDPIFVFYLLLAFGLILILAGMVRRTPSR